MSRITQRNTDRSTIETWGSASVSPTDDVVVGSFATWTLTFTVGAYAMDVGGGLKIGTRRQADFGTPQFGDPAGDNFTTVTCSREGSRFETTFDSRGHKRPFNAVTVIRLAAGPLYPGDTVTAVLGDRSGGSRGLQVQSFPEAASDFAVFVDPLSSGEYKRVYCTSPNFRIRSGPAETLTAVAPTIVEAGKPFRVQVRANDRFGNPTPVDAPGLTLDADPPVVVNLRQETGRATWIDGVTLGAAGVRRLVLANDDAILAVTNPVVVRDHADEIICWGDTQAQTASTVGVGTPDEYFAYARDLAAIDFTTHQGNDFILSDADLEEVRLAAGKYNDPGRFVTFFGWEWSGPTGTGGDRNVMFLDDDGPIYRSSHWQLCSEEMSEHAGATECVHARDLQARMRQYMVETGRKVIMVPHIGGRRSDFQAQDRAIPLSGKGVTGACSAAHFGEHFVSECQAGPRGAAVDPAAGKPAPVAGTRSRQKNGPEAQDTELEPVFEICSNHGIFEWRLHEFLRAGVHVGVVGASDDHTCRPGLAYPSTPEMTILGGLGAVYSRELTRQGIYDGLMARHCYGTTGARMHVEVAAGAMPMGRVCETEHPPTISGVVHGTAPIEAVTLFDRSRERARFRPNPRVRDVTRLRMTWSGANGPDRGRFMDWRGELRIDGGRIVDAQPFNIFTAKYGITERSDKRVAWSSVTSGQEEGLLLELDAPDQATIAFTAGPADLSFRLGEARERRPGLGSGRPGAAGSGEHPSHIR